MNAQSSVKKHHMGLISPLPLLFRIVRMLYVQTSYSLNLTLRITEQQPTVSLLQEPFPIFNIDGTFMHHASCSPLMHKYRSDRVSTAVVQRCRHILPSPSTTPSRSRMRRRHHFESPLSFPAVEANNNGRKEVLRCARLAKAMGSQPPGAAPRRPTRNLYLRVVDTTGTWAILAACVWYVSDPRTAINKHGMFADCVHPLNGQLMCMGTIGLAHSNILEYVCESAVSKHAKH